MRAAAAPIHMQERPVAIAAARDIIPSSASDRVDPQAQPQHLRDWTDLIAAAKPVHYVMVSWHDNVMAATALLVGDVSVPSKCRFV